MDFCIVYAQFLLETETDLASMNSRDEKVWIKFAFFIFRVLIGTRNTHINHLKIR